MPERVTPDMETTPDTVTKDAPDMETIKFKEISFFS